MHRRMYSIQFKLDAVRRVTCDGVPAYQVARQLGISANVLKRWVAKDAAGQLQDEPGPVGGAPDLQGMTLELARLRQELACTVAERDRLLSLVRDVAGLRRDP